MSDKVGELPAKWRQVTSGGCANVHHRLADELEAALSAHGQPVVDEKALMTLIEEIRREADILAIDDGRGPLPLSFYLRRYVDLTAALTGATK